jgi:hypothetical protein
MDQYVGNQGAPPKGMGNVSETEPGLIAPYAGALALITPLKSEAISNLRSIKEIAPDSYDESHGYHDSLIVNESNTAYRRSSEGFSALSQEWIFLSIANCEKGTIWRYFNNDTGVKEAYKEMYT